MAFALQPAERRVIEETVRFANRRRITSPHQVEKRFSGLDLVPGVFQVINPGDMGAYRRDQAELRGWLTRIARHADAPRSRAQERRERQAVAREVQARLGATVPARMWLDPGSLGLGVAYALTGVQAAYAFGVALILARGVVNRLYQCPSCDRFVPNLDIKGRPRTTCNDTCKRTYDGTTAAERVRRYRKANPQRSRHFGR